MSDLGDDGRLWLSWEIRRDQGGYRWMVEGVGPNGFSRQALGVTATSWGAGRKVKRYRKQWRKESRAR